MINFNKPHMVPQTTKSLAQGAEGQRQKQIDAYSKDRSNNKRQMDDIHHAQYRKQNTAVKSQKSHMQDNAAKASKRITGSSNYYKEHKNYKNFMQFCEDQVPDPWSTPKYTGVPKRKRVDDGDRETPREYRRYAADMSGEETKRKKASDKEKRAKSDEVKRVAKGARQQTETKERDKASKKVSAAEKRGFTAGRKKASEEAKERTKRATATNRVRGMTPEERKEKEAAVEKRAKRSAKATKAMAKAETRRADTADKDLEYRKSRDTARDAEKAAAKKAAAEKEKEEASKRRKYVTPGLKGSLGRELGTDLLARDKDKRREARGRLGTAIGKGIKSVPGRAFNAVVGAMKRSSSEPVPTGSAASGPVARGSVVDD